MSPARAPVTMPRRRCAGVLLLGLLAAATSLHAQDTTATDAQAVAWGDLTTQYTMLFRVKRYEEATKIAEQAVEAAEQAFGPEHPNVAQSLENYAGLLRKTNRVAEAVEVETRARAIREKQASRKPKD